MDNQSFQFLTQEEIKNISFEKVQNFNIGIMGHIDSGKTSITKVLTTIASTASLDHSPISQDKGITIDLGFSSFMLKLNKYKEKFEKDYVQVTIVDCPGHASFIKSVIAGASIIDLMILVIDINKGIQVQTAECLALGEILKFDLVVVLNKIDLLKEDKRQQVIDKNIKKIKNLISKTQYPNKNNVQVLPFSIKNQDINLLKSKLIEGVLETVKEIQREKIEDKNLMIIDHCFDLKGKGTVLTGTVIYGKFQLNDKVVIPEKGIERVIKTMQSFKVKREKGISGDRLAFMVPKLQSEEIERCYLTSNPETFQKIEGFIGTIDMCNYYKNDINNNSKFHLTIGHVNLMADLLLICVEKNKLNIQDQSFKRFSVFKQQGQYEFHNLEYEQVYTINNQKIVFNNREETYEDLSKNNKMILCVFQFQKHIHLLDKNFYLASRLDLKTDKKNCRIAFSGFSLKNINKIDPFLQNLKVFTKKYKKGIAERIFDDYTIIVKDLFTKQTDVSKFFGKQIFFKDHSDIQGEIFASFGSSGKVRVKFEFNIREKLDDVKNKEIYMVIKKYNKLTQNNFIIYLSQIRQQISYLYIFRLFILYFSVMVMISQQQYIIVFIFQTQFSLIFQQSLISSSLRITVVFMVLFILDFNVKSS